jgi:hypothetical protein
MQPTRPTFRIRIPALALILVMALIASPAQSQRTKSSLNAGKQRNAEKGLKDNRYFFYFINTSITNMGTDDEKKLFKEAIQRDIIAQQLYMKFLFGESWDEIRKAQKILIDLYQKTLNRDISMAKKLLNSVAPGVVKSNNFMPRHYLRLGYRDAEDARIDLVMADNFQEFLYSMRLYRYSKAIKKVKHGKRYALLSLLETKIPHDPKTEFGHRTFDELKKLIGDASDDATREYHLLVHADNYYKSKDEKSFFDTVWENPNLDEIQEYRHYLEMQ